MSTSTAQAPTTSSASAAPAPTRWQQHRSTLLIVGGLLVAVAVVALLGGGGQTGDPLDPGNPGPDGARAVARVLGDDGVDVRVARGEDELADLDVDATATVLVVDPDLLGDGALEALHDRFGDRLVVAGAGSAVTSALGADDLPGRVRVGDARDAECDGADAGGLGDLVSDLEVSVDAAFAYPGAGCFPGRYGVLLTDVDGVTLLGADQALSNGQVLRADNAALALRVLGQDDELVWYVPSVDDLDGGGVSVSSLLPRWLEPGLVVGALALLGLAVWRGRRLGALAIEPVPVVVRAVETTDSLGRLYRRSGDRAHAATALRRAALRRTASRLQLGRHADPDVVVAALARHLDRPVEQVAAVLSPAAPPPTTDPGLIALAHDLAELDREARRP